MPQAFEACTKVPFLQCTDTPQDAFPARELTRILITYKLWKIERPVGALNYEEAVLRPTGQLLGPR